ncbi:MAG: SRPBCC family protein [Planctomyces sp.]|nr:SRPBCC family protein [Planctomyces sp.]
MVTVRRDRQRGGWVLNCDLWLPAPIGRVFEFFSDAFQLEAITPPWLRFRVITPAPIEIEEGTRIDYRLRLRGIPVRWRSAISVWQPPYRFVDEQLAGPYRLWRHEHTFVSERGGTRCADEVHYDVPGGRLVNWLIVQRDVETIFRYRAERLRELFPSDEAAANRERAPAGAEDSAGRGNSAGR